MIAVHGSPYILGGIFGGVCAGYMKSGALRAMLILPLFLAISAVIATIDTLYIASSFTHSEAGSAWAVAGVFFAFIFFGGPVGFVVMLLTLARRDRAHRSSILEIDNAVK